MPNVFNHFDVRVQLLDNELIDPLELRSYGCLYLLHGVLGGMESARAC
jgi:hypothetical protein